MARSSFFSSCSTWMLPLLVLFCVVPSSSLCNWSHIHAEVDALGCHVKNCSATCPVPVTFPPRDMCDCFHVSVPSTNGSALNYVIEALNSTHSSIRSHELFEHLMWRLEECLKLNILVTVPYEPVLSPMGLYKKLKFLSEKMNSNESRTS